MRSLSSLARQVCGIGLLIIGSALVAFSFIFFAHSTAVGLITLLSGCALAFMGSSMRKRTLSVADRPPYNRFITLVASSIVLIATAFVGFILALIWFNRVR